MSRLSRTALTVLCAVTVGCGPGTEVQPPASLLATHTGPTVLVIGDSISLGWMPHLQALKPGVLLHHAPGNSMSSRHGAAQITAWLSPRAQWDAVLFNHGIWDATPYSGTDPAEAWFYETPRAEYEANLRVIASAITQRTPCPVFLLTTHATAASPSLDAEIQARNVIASQVMADFGIPTVDLYTASLTAEERRPGDIHYSEAGSLTLAVAIAGGILCF